MDNKLYVVMAGLPARGKTTIAAKLRQNLSHDSVRTRIFNNGELRRKMIRENTSYARFFDPQNKEGVALNHRIYRATTRDFKDYSRAELFLDPGFNVIDATIVRDGARFLMFLKDETQRPEARKDIRLAVADHALGPYVVGPGPISKENWVEGPTAFRAGQDMIVLFDAYTRKRYEGIRSRDLKTWAALDAGLEMPAGARHGTVLAVPEKILKGLLAAAPPGSPTLE